jgi:hypothetical protein
MRQDTQLLIEALQNSFSTLSSDGASEAWPVPPLNVIDCVLSLNRNYDRFCLPRVQRFANQHPNVNTLSGLLQLIDKYSSPLEFSIIELNYRDAKRAKTLVGVLQYLLQVQTGFSDSSETNRLRDWANSTKPYDYEALRIQGFGLSGFQYLRMLFGAQTVKPDAHIRRFVSKAVGRAVQDAHALTLLEAAGNYLAWPLATLDYAIWDRLARHQVNLEPCRNP